MYKSKMAHKSFRISEYFIDPIQWNENLYKLVFGKHYSIMYEKKGNGRNLIYRKANQIRIHRMKILLIFLRNKS